MLQEALQEEAYKNLKVFQGCDWKFKLKVPMKIFKDSGGKYLHLTCLKKHLGQDIIIFITSSVALSSSLLPSSSLSFRTLCIIRRKSPHLVHISVTNINMFP